MRTTIYVLVVAMAACGGGSGTSGVDSSKHVNSLSDGEAQTFCEWAVDEQGGAGTVTDCGDGLTITVDTVAECVAKQGNYTSDCAATVADAEACTTAIGNDPCSFGGNACAALFACIPG